MTGMNLREKRPLAAILVHSLALKYLRMAKHHNKAEVSLMAYFELEVP